MKKILVFGEKYFNYTDSVVSALERLGYLTEVVYMPVINKTKMNIYDKIKYKCNEKFFIDNFVNDVRKNLFYKINLFRPEIFLSINGNFYCEYITKDIIDVLKKNKCQTNLWYMDSIKRCEDVEQNINNFDRVFVFELNDIEYIKNKYGKESYYLPIGIDEEIYNKKEKIKKDIDISFVGYPSNKRLNILEIIAKFCYLNNNVMKVFGIYYGNGLISKIKFKLKYPYLFKFVCNKLIYDKEVADVYNRSIICLNIHIAEHKGLNPRTFEIMSTYSFELCDERIDFKKFGIIAGEHIDTYKNEEDIIPKIEFYLKNNEKRNKIAEQAGRLVNNNFTIKNLIGKFF